MIKHENKKKVLPGKYVISFGKNNKFSWEFINSKILFNTSQVNTKKQFSSR